MAGLGQMITFLTFYLSGFTTGNKSRPFISTREQVYSVHEGDTVLLDCEVENLGDGILLWKQGPRVLTAGGMQVRRDPRLELVGSSLQISLVEVEDGGEYLCEVESSKEIPVSIKHTVDVLFSPTILPIPETGVVLVKEGDSVTVSCNVKGNPLPKVTWTRNSSVLQDGYSLHINNIDRLFAGEYMCTADNGVGSRASAVVTIGVLFPPVVETSVPSVLGGVGRRVEVTCTAHANPEPQVKWFRNNGKEVEAQMGAVSFWSNQTFNKLVIHRLAESDYGEYICEARNSLGSSRSRISLTGKPEKPVLSETVQRMDTGEYRVSWTVRSFSPLVEHTLFYRRFQIGDDTGWTMIKILSSGDHSDRTDSGFTLRSLELGVQYQVQVESKNKYGSSELSKPIFFTTSSVVEESQEEYLKNLLFFRSYGCRLYAQLFVILSSTCLIVFCDCLFF